MSKDLGYTDEDGKFMVTKWVKSPIDIGYQIRTLKPLKECFDIALTELLIKFTKDE